MNNILPIQAPIGGIRGLVQPSLGIGLLRYYQNLSQPDKCGTITFTFEAEPWHQTGLQPFNWDYIWLPGENSFPIIRIVAARNVRITEHRKTVFNRRTTEEKKLLLGIPSTKSSLIQIFRPQNNCLVPNAEDVIYPSKIIGTPFSMAAFYLDPFNNANVEPERLYQYQPDALEQDIENQIKEDVNPQWKQLLGVKVTPFPTSVLIQNLYNLFELSIVIKEPLQPAAFAYEVDSFNKQVFIIRIVHSENVEITDIRSCITIVSFLFIYVAKVDSVKDVPEQGNHIDQEKFKFKLIPDSEIDVTLTGKMIADIEMIIGVIPFIGDLYDIGQLIYSYIYGKDFWGRSVTVSEEEICIMTIIIILPTVLEKLAKPIKNLLRQRKVTHLLKSIEPTFQAKLKKYINQDLFASISKLNPTSQKKLLQDLDKLLSGKLSKIDFLARFGDLVKQDYTQQVVEKGIFQLFSDDFRGFKNVKLQEGFQQASSAF